MATTAAKAISAYQANPNIAPQVISDTAANISFYFNGLQTLYAAGKLTSISISSRSKVLTITGAQYSGDSGAISKIITSYSLVVSAVPAALAGVLQANTHVTSFTLQDSSANVASNFDALNADTKLKSVTLSDSNPLALTYSQWTKDTAILAKLPSSYTVALSGVSAANAATVQANAHVASFSVSDSSANIAANLNALNADTKLASITLTDGSPLAITYAQFLADSNVIGKLPANSLSVSGAPVSAAAALQASGKIVSFKISDSSSAVASGLDALNADSKLASITLTDTNPLSISYSQLQADATALGKLPSSYTLIVSGVSAAGAGAVQGNSHVTSFTVSDNAANISTWFDALNGDAKLSAIALTDGNPLSITYTQLSAGTAALAKLPSNYMLGVQGVSANGAATVQANAHVGKFWVTDGSSSVAGGLDGLNASTKLTGIALLDGNPLAITYTQLVNDTNALSKLPSSYTLSVSGVPLDAVSLVQANTHITSYTLAGDQTPPPSPPPVTSALGTALQNAINGGYVAHLTEKTYTVDSPIVINITSTMQGAVGIDGGGAKIISNITDGSPVILINVAAGVDLRYLNLSNFSIYGNGHEGDGIKIVADGADRSVYNWNIDNVNVEHVGGIGLDAIGNVFEGTVSNSWMNGNGGGGARFSNTASGGVASGLKWEGGGFRNNQVAGLMLDNGARDMSVSDAYFVENKGPGISAASGITEVSTSGFENNQGQGIVFQNYGNFVNNSFSTWGPQQVGISGNLAGEALMSGNTNEYYGSGTDTTKLGNLQGSGALSLIGGGNIVTSSSVVTNGASNAVITHGYMAVSFPTEHAPSQTTGNATTTASSSFGAALQSAVAGGYVAHLTQPTYTVNAPIMINITSTMQGAVGIDGGGAKIISNITDGSPVIQINVGPGVDLRYLTLSNFSIEGNGKEGDGIKIVADGNDRWVYNWNIDNVNVDHVGGIGLNVEGSIFEGSVTDSWMTGNGGGGARFAHSANGGMASALKWEGGGFRDNQVAGLLLDNGARDMSVSDAHFTDNHGPGISAPGGITSVMTSGFENNQGQGIVFQNYGNFIDNTFTTSGSQTVGISGWLAGQAVMMGNKEQYTGTGTDPTKLANLQGNGSLTIKGDGNVLTGNNVVTNGPSAAVITQGYMAVSFPTEHAPSQTTGNATTTASSSFGSALQNAMAGGYVAHLTEPTYTVNAPIVINVTSTMQGAVGIDGGGAKIISNITDGSPVIQINVGPGVDLRYLTLSNFSIYGNGHEGDGIKIVADGNDRWVYNWSIDSVNVEHVGGIGLNVEGSVFEGSVTNSWMNGNGGGGARFAHSANGGAASALKWEGGGFRNNQVAGLMLDNGARDMSVSDAYFVENKGPGISAPGGITSVSTSGFENNQSQGIVFQNYGNFVNNSFSTWGPQQVGISGYLAGQASMIGNTSEYYGSGANTTKLANLQGNGGLTLIGSGNVVTGSNVTTNAGSSAVITQSTVQTTTSLASPTLMAASTTGTQTDANQKLPINSQQLQIGNEIHGTDGHAHRGEVLRALLDRLGNRGLLTAQDFAAGRHADPSSTPPHDAGGLPTVSSKVGGLPIFEDKGQGIQSALKPHT